MINELVIENAKKKLLSYLLSAYCCNYKSSIAKHELGVDQVSLIQFHFSLLPAKGRIIMFSCGPHVLCISLPIVSVEVEIPCDSICQQTPSSEGDFTRAESTYCKSERKGSKCQI